MAAVQVVVFSKDRPFQLSQYLDTLGRRMKSNGIPAHTEGPGSSVDGYPERAVVVEVDVIFAWSTVETKEDYLRVKEGWKGQHAQQAGSSSMVIRFWQESDSNPEGFTFEAALNSALEESRAPAVMFGVDDVLFLDDLPIRGALDLILATDSEGPADEEAIACIHFKLHPGIEYSHPSKDVLRKPKLRPEGADFLSFQLDVGSGDWNYAWELCATLYRRADVLSILQQIAEQDSKGLSHPNRLEAAGMKVLRSGKGPSTFCHPKARAACLQRRSIAVVTVNRVQDVFPNHVFAATDGKGHLSSLNGLLGSQRFDEEAYLADNAPCVHVGGVYTAPVHQSLGAQTDPLVSVVMPARNAVKFVEDAISSVLMQSFRHFELIVVDDRSTDGTTEVLQRLAATDARVRLLRTNGEPEGSYNPVARAINLAISHSRCNFVARMDADDVAHPDRLRRQLLFMQANSDVAVVGSAVEMIGAVPESALSAAELSSPIGSTESRIVAHPTSPAMTKFSAAFYCPLAHPTVLARKDALKQVINYDEAAMHCEDYDLWGRMIQCGLRLANLGDVLLKLRKHANNTSAAEVDSRRLASLSVSSRLLSQSLGQDVSEDALALLRRPSPDQMASPAVLVDATHLLEAWMAHCVDHEAGGALYSDIGVQQVKLDGYNRAGQLATLGVSKFPASPEVTLDARPAPRPLTPMRGWA